MNSFNFAKLAILFLIGINIVNCQERTIQSSVREHLYDISDQLEEAHNIQSGNAIHRTISVFGKEYHFYPDGQIEKGELYAIGQPDEITEHEPTKIKESEFDDFITELEKPNKINIIKSSDYWDDEFGSYYIALVFLKPGVGDDES